MYLNRKTFPTRKEAENYKTKFFASTVAKTTDGWEVSWPQLREANEIPKASCYQQEDGTYGYFFGDTSIFVNQEVGPDGKLHLTPVAGDQIACGEWYDLTEDKVADYCQLLELWLNSRKEA